MTPDSSADRVLRDDRRGALLSDDREYRYRLWRTWDAQKPVLTWILLNPSTADETDDDSTLRRCIGYAKDWGYGGVVLGNLFALRSKHPEDLREHPDPVGPRNDEHLRAIAAEADRTVAAWGAHGDLKDRADEVAGLLDVDLYAIGTTKDGHPLHPLYKSADLKPERWSP